MLGEGERRRRKKRQALLNKSTFCSGPRPCFIVSLSFLQFSSDNYIDLLLCLRTTVGSPAGIFSPESFIFLLEGKSVR